MARARGALSLQQYPRIGEQLLSKGELYPMPKKPTDWKMIDSLIESSFKRCLLNKQGKPKKINSTPKELVEMCIDHLKTRSDPILNTYLISRCRVEELFEIDAVSHEMQRHRMTIGVFYQYLILELMKQRWSVFDGSREGDIIADIDTPTFEIGLRLYMSVKKSIDTVGGQDIGNVIRNLERLAKEEKNLTRPYLCVVGIATPEKGKLRPYSADRRIKCNIQRQPYSLNCEVWGPGFIFPYITGRDAVDIYKHSIKQVANYLPFQSLDHRKECSILLKMRLKELDLLNADETINPDKFLSFVSVKG